MSGDVGEKATAKVDGWTGQRKVWMVVGEYRRLRRRRWRTIVVMQGM